jgi:hypothetical protein
MANPYSGDEGFPAQMCALWEALHAAGEAGMTAEELLDRMRAVPAWKLPKGPSALGKARARPGAAQCWREG